MNTILTDDERRAIMSEWTRDSYESPWSLLEATEAAVLAKLREQAPQDIAHVGQGLVDVWKSRAAPLPAVVPQGWKLVPVEPTREMWAAVSKLDDQCAAGNYDGKGCSIEQAWDCLLAAAPEVPAQTDTEAINRGCRYTTDLMKAPALPAEVREALKVARKALEAIRFGCENIATSDWRGWQELASPQEFERWAKSRAAHMTDAARAALARIDALGGGE